MRRAGRSLITWTLVIALPALAWARAGSLDPTFGSGGITTVPSSALNDFYGGLEIEPDGRIVASGTSDPGFPPASVVLAKYLPGGTLDPSFGTGGVASTILHPDLYVFGGGPARQPDGKLVVSAYLSPSAPPFYYRSIVARFDADGAVDTGFGTGGLTTLADSTTGSFVLGHPVLQADGKILVGGFLGPFGDQALAVARLDPSGSLDPGFGTGGIATVDPGGSFASGDGIVVQPDGRIVAAGSFDTGTGSDVLLVRLDASGTLDPSFGAGGMVMTDLGGDESATRVLL